MFDVRPRNTVLVPRPDAMCFIDGYKAVLLAVFTTAGSRRTTNLINDLADARSHAAVNPKALDSAIDMVKARGDLLSSEIEHAVRSLRVGRWFHLRHTTRYALLLDEAAENAYAIKALTTPLHEIVGSKAVSFEAGVVEYKGQYVCDGIVLNPLYLGPGMRESLKEAYARIKREGRFHMSVAA